MLKLRSHISKLDGVRKALEKIAKDTDSNVTELLQNMNSVTKQKIMILFTTYSENYDRMDNLVPMSEKLYILSIIEVIQNERILLRDAALRQEFKDHHDGLSKREFTRFVRVMPSKREFIDFQISFSFEKSFVRL